MAGFNSGMNRQPAFGRKGTERTTNASEAGQTGIATLQDLRAINDEQLSGLVNRYIEIRTYQKAGDSAGSTDANTLDGLLDQMIARLREHGKQMPKKDLASLLEQAE